MADGFTIGEALERFTAAAHLGLRKRELSEKPAAGQLVATGYSLDRREYETIPAVLWTRYTYSELSDSVSLPGGRETFLDVRIRVPQPDAL